MACLVPSVTGPPPPKPGKILIHSTYILYITLCSSVVGVGVVVMASQPIGILPDPGRANITSDFRPPNPNKQPLHLHTVGWEWGSSAGQPDFCISDQFAWSMIRISLGASGLPYYVCMCMLYQSDGPAPAKGFRHFCPP
jgi:hypothetical protein